MVESSRQECLAAAIRAAMDDADATPEQLARVVSASARTIARWRSGTGMPDALQLRPMADFLSVDPMLFVDPPQPQPYPLEAYRLSPEEVANAAARLAHHDQAGEGAGGQPVEAPRPEPRRRRAETTPR